MRENKKARKENRSRDGKREREKGRARGTRATKASNLAFTR